MNLDQFIQTYTGQYNVGDTPQNIGQCVGLIEVWTDNLGEPHTWGNAKDLCYNADRHSFDVTFNSPGAVPQRGDIFTFDGTYGAGNGHTGIVTSADNNSVTLFEQNDPWGTRPHLKTYSYDHAIGWIHPKVLNQGDIMPSSQDVADALTVQLLYNIGLDRQPNDQELQARNGQSVELIARDILSSEEHKQIQADAATGADMRTKGLTTLAPGVYKVE